MTPRQTTEEVMKEFGADDFYNKLHSDAQMGIDLREMMETKGWKEWFHPMIEETLKKMDSIEGVTTLKELEGKKQARAALQLLLGSFASLVDQGEMAVLQLEQAKQEQQVDS